MNEISSVFDPNFSRLTEAMENAMLRQAITAHNIANANTPGYKALTFDEELKKATKRQNSKVDLDTEHAEMGKIAVEHGVLVNLYNKKLNVLKIIASQGRR